MLKRLKEYNFLHIAPLIVSITITINGFITIFATAIPLLNSMFKIHLDNKISSDLYTLGMQFDAGLGVATPILLGYLMITIAKGIFQRKRAFWAIAVVLITLSIVMDYIQDDTFSYNLTFIVHTIEIFLLIAFAKVFNRKVDKRISFSQFMLIVTFLMALAYSVLGVYYLKDQFNGIKNLTDAVYFTFVTFSTVGYGDITPITEQAKVFTMSVMILGIGIFAAVVTFFASSVIGKIMDKFKFKNGVIFMKNHVVMCGYTEISKYLLSKYAKDFTDYIVIQENYKDKFLSLSDDIDANFIDAESSDYAALKQANVCKAKTIMILSDKDSDNILSLLAIKEYLKQAGVTKMPKISIKLDKEENINIAENIGVDLVVSPTKKVAESLMKSFDESIL